MTGRRKARIVRLVGKRSVTVRQLPPTGTVKVSVKGLNAKGRTGKAATKRAKAKKAKAHHKKKRRKK